MRGLLLCLVMGIAQAQALPSAINSSTHADVFIGQAVVAILGSNPFQIDYDTIRSIPMTLANSSNTSATFTSVATGLPANHAPYMVLNASACQYMPLYDQQYYATLLGQNAIYTIPVGAAISSCGPLPNGTAPGILISSATSANSGDGGTGWGVEFSLSASYKGLDTTEDSWDSAEMAGFYLAMSDQHPTWNWFDIKAAFRQTATNWSTGYNATNFGYGTLNYDSATAIGATSSLYLQPPGILVQNNSHYAAITLYPFRQARRHAEAIYSVNPSYAWPVKNEYTSADIAASGATLLYTSNGTDIEPEFSYAPAVTGTITIVAFTTDGLGNYSRVEPFSEMSATLTVGTACVP